MPRTACRKTTLELNQLLVGLTVLSLLLALVNCGGGSSTSTQTQNTNVVLPIAPVMQETPDWCWLAGGQMVFQYFQVPAVNPNYQCGIIAAFAGVYSPCWYDCSLCPFAAGSNENISLMLQEYAQVATNGTETLTFQYAPSPLAQPQVQAELDAKRPILVGINPSGTVIFSESQHVVVVVGYQEQNGQFNVVVNDPFPFALAGYPDPYLAVGATQIQAGQYAISYQSFVNSILWNASWYQMAVI